MFKKTPIIISEDDPLIIGKLLVYPEKLQYERIRCNFLDIVHIGWYWSSQNISAINTQNARLRIYIRGRKIPIYISKSTLYFKPKIVIAYDYIAKETFHNRLKFYTSQLEKIGGFTYENCNIYSDGSIVSNDTTYSLSLADISPFELEIKQGGLFSKKLQISLNIDRDVILTLFDFILENPQNPSVYIENHKRQSNSEESISKFIRDIVSLMAKLSSADGYVSPEEIEIVKYFLINTMKLNKESLSSAISVFNSAKLSPNSFEYFAESLLLQFGNDKNVLSGVLDLLFSVAIADGVLSAEEELLILEAESIFDLQGEAYNSFRNQAQESTSTKKEYYLNIFGLSSSATKAEIKYHYKRLVMKFHPDRMQHLGEEFINEAEQKMKEINEAYSFLCP